MEKNKKTLKEMPDKDDFMSFLSQKIFKEPIISVFQFKRGASSFNYLVTLQNKKVLVKLAWKHQKKGVERLVDIITLLSSQKHIPISKIISFNEKIIFEYKNSYGFVLEYIDGSSLSANKIKINHIKQIFQSYKYIEKTPIQNKKLLIPAYNFQKIQKEYLANCDKMIQKYSHKKLFLFLLKECKKNLIKIGESSLKISNDKKTIIHGDFHHNNILFNNNKLVAFLDLEDLGYGYKSEDIIRFILCLTARLPIFYSKKKILYKYLNYATDEFDLTNEEWLVGLNSFTLQKYKKMFGRVHKANLSNTKKLIQLLIFMHQYKHIECYLKNKLIS